MQQAGDCTQESEFARPSNVGGIARWFPDGFHSQGVDWSGLEEHLLTVPDLAFQTTTSSSNRDIPDGRKNIPKGVCALHLAVSCCNPPAPISLIQRLININHDALHQGESQYGWNVLHCALKFNDTIKADGDGENIVDLLLEARPDLVCDGATSVDEYGLPPVAYAKCPGIVTKLVKLMPPKLAASILKKIFKRRKLLGGSPEAMAQLIRELSEVEIRQSRAILTPSIMTENSASRQPLIKYVLVQTSKCGRSSEERSNLKHLIDPIVQAVYSFHLLKQGNLSLQEYDNLPCPSAIECLKALLSAKKLGHKVVTLYTSVMNGNAEYSENMDLLEPDLAGTGSSRIGMDSETMGRSVTDFPFESSAHNPTIEKLLKCKVDLDVRVAESLDALRKAATVLENYKASYSQMVDTLCQEASAMANTQSESASSHYLLSSKHDSVMDGSVPSVAISLETTDSPKRHKTSSGEGKAHRPVESGNNNGVSVESAIDNMKAAASGLDQYAKKVTFDSESFLRQQADLETVDMAFFRSAMHDQAARALDQLAELQIEKTSLQKCRDEVKSQLKEIESLGDKETKASYTELHGRSITLKEELRDVTRKVEDLKQVVTARRQEIGEHMIKARRLVHNKKGTNNRVVRQRAIRFLNEAKKETRALMATLVETSPKFKSFSRHRKKKWKQLHQRDLQLDEQIRRTEEDEELNRMTKRMRL